MINAYAAHEPGGKLKPFRFDPGPLHADEVELEVHHCGICHSDLSMWNNDWGMTAYPFVPGHEVVGKIIAVGDAVKHLKVGQVAGLGWQAGSCMHCDQCMRGDHNLCSHSEATIVGRYGGFADKVRAKSAWVIPLPEDLNPADVGPMFCGGITVFSPIIENQVSPLDHVGVVGIGGLGHMALAFLKHWGCEVTAFSTSSNKEPEARALGAHHFVNTKEERALERLKNRFDMILVTVNVPLPWEKYIAALKPKGRLHLVGAAPSVSSAVFPLIGGQKSIGASPIGSPYNTQKMLEFAARHTIEPITEHFKLEEVNAAMAHLASGQARYRIILDMKA